MIIKSNKTTDEKLAILIKHIDICGECVYDLDEADFTNLCGDGEKLLDAFMGLSSQRKENARRKP